MKPFFETTLISDYDKVIIPFDKVEQVYENSGIYKGEQKHSITIVKTSGKVVKFTHEYISEGRRFVEDYKKYMNNKG